jgi:hypothetical protein
MKNLILVLILGFGFFSCKKEEKIICKPLICKECKYVTYVKTKINKVESILLIQDAKICGEEEFYGKKTISISIFSDSIGTRYRYEMNCQDKFDTIPNIKEN